MSSNMIVNSFFIHEKRIMSDHVINAVDMQEATLAMHTRRVSLFSHVELCRMLKSLLDRLIWIPCKVRTKSFDIRLLRDNRLRRSVRQLYIVSLGCCIKVQFMCAVDWFVV